MAANYWLSTQCNNWLLDAPQLAQSRSEDALYATPLELSSLHLWMCTQATQICKRLALRQRVVATACVFLGRFFAKNSYAAVDVLLVVSSAVYVAAKVEESPVHIKSMCVEISRHFDQSGSRGFHLDTSTLAEMEFYLVEELEFDLVVYHPYRSLVAMYDEVGVRRSSSSSSSSSSSTTRGGGGGEVSSMGMTTTMSGGVGLGIPLSTSTSSSSAVGGGGMDSSTLSSSTTPSSSTTTTGTGGAGGGIGDQDSPPGKVQELDETTVQLSWFILNDSYGCTDVALRFPPHLIAIAAVWMAMLLHPPARERIMSDLKGERERRRAWRVEWEEMIHPPRSSRTQPSGLASDGQGSKNGGRTSEPATDSPFTIPTEPRPSPSATLTWLASLNVSLPTVAEIVEALVRGYDCEAQVRKAASDGAEMVRLLERMREARLTLLRRARNSAATRSEMNLPLVT